MFRQKVEYSFGVKGISPVSLLRWGFFSCTESDRDLTPKESVMDILSIFIAIISTLLIFFKEEIKEWLFK